MLSAFPELYNYSYFAPSLLRLATGAFFIIYGSKNIFSVGGGDSQTKAKLTIPKILGVLEFLCGALLLVGLFVQPVAIAMSAILIAAMVFRSGPEFGGAGGQYGLRLILLVVLLSLVVLGPGLFSLDLPL